MTDHREQVLQLLQRMDQAERELAAMRSERARLLARWRQDGATLDSIAAEVDRTRQTIHQWTRH